MSTDHESLVNAIRHLAVFDRISPDRARSRDLAVRVIDCVLSLNRNYDRFVVTKLNSFEQNLSQGCSVRDLNACILKYSSPHEFVLCTLSYNDEARATTLASVADWLATICGNGTPTAELANLEGWARNALYAGYKALGIRGFGLSGFQYLRMLFGANTTKPDLGIRQWVGPIVGHPVSDVQALLLLERAAPDADVRLRDTDTTIWAKLAWGPKFWCVVTRIRNPRSARLHSDGHVPRALAPGRLHRHLDILAEGGQKFH